MENKNHGHALIFTRLDSTRLPQKALKKIGDECLLEFVIKRLKKSKFFKPILLTTIRSVDDPLEAVANNCCIDIYRGTLDVATRVHDYLEKFDIDIFARVNGDSPFVDWELLDKGYQKLIEENSDIITNLIPRTFPYGVSIEILKSSLFLSNYNLIKDNEHYSEHITSMFYDNFSNYKSSVIANDFGNQSNYQLTIDTYKDLQKIRNLNSKFANLIDIKYNQIIELIKKTDD